MSFERQLPLEKASHLADDRELAIKVFNLSSKTIGGVARVLKKAAVEAIKSNKEVIDLQVLDSIKHVRVADFGSQTGDE